MTLEGTLLGKYRILSHLGEGGMGSVYHARDEMLDRDVAIKVLRPDLSGKVSLVERFRSEAIALARLAHPRIAMLHGLERDGERLLMVMEYLPGETLEALIRRTGGVPWARAARHCVGVCEALEHAHEHGVVHRDIKPANIMLSEGGTIKVMDFGIARVVGRSRQTQVGRSVGTPTYMAPEQLRGEEVDGRADLYAVGAVLYELITGKLAFDADSDYSLMLKQLNDPPPRPGLSVTGVPPELDEIVTRSMAKVADARFADAAGMRAALEAAVRAAPREEPAVKKKARPVPVTRLAEDSPPPPPPAPRHSPARVPAEPAARAHAIRAVTDGAGSRITRWVRDWRAWAGAAAVIVIAALAVRAGRTPSAAPQVAQPTAAPATSPAPAPAPPPPAPVPPPPPPAPEPVPPAPPPPPPKPPAPDPRLEGARPMPVEGEAPPARSVPPPAPPATPPNRKAEAPPKAAPVTRPEVPGRAADPGSVAGVVTSWLAGIGSREVARVSALSPEPKPHAQLLALMRSGRVSLAGHEVPGVEINGGTATATVSTTLAYRTAFGAGRKTEVRFAFDLAQEGSRWRVARARILGTPRLD